MTSQILLMCGISMAALYVRYLYAMCGSVISMAVLYARCIIYGCVISVMSVPVL